jgi:hypothetical protein
MAAGIKRPVVNKRAVLVLALPTAHGIAFEIRDIN